MNSSNLGRMPVWQSIFNLAPAPWWIVASMGWCGAPGGQSLLQVMRHGGYMTEQWMIGDFIDFWGKLPLIAPCYCCFFYSMRFSVCQDFDNEKLHNCGVGSHWKTHKIHPLFTQKRLLEACPSWTCWWLNELASEWWRGLPPIFDFLQIQMMVFYNDSMLQAHKLRSAKVQFFRAPAAGANKRWASKIR